VCGSETRERFVRARDETLTRFATGVNFLGWCPVPQVALESRRVSVCADASERLPYRRCALFDLFACLLARDAGSPASRLLPPDPPSLCFEIDALAAGGRLLVEDGAQGYHQARGLEWFLHEACEAAAFEAAGGIGFVV